jgi:hypothetical protein
LKSSEKLVGLDFVNATLRSEFTQPFNKKSAEQWRKHLSQTYGGAAGRRPSIGRNQNSHSVRDHYRTYSIRFDVAGCRRGVSHGINRDIAGKLAIVSSSEETDPTPMPPFPHHRADATTNFFG